MTTLVRGILDLSLQNIGGKAIIWTLMKENPTLLHVNNKVANQPGHLSSLIKAFVIRKLNNKVFKLLVSIF